MSSTLNIGITGLKAAQIGITTTTHNISNAATPGYSRQESIQSNRQPLATGVGFIGQGVEVNTVRRIYSDFLINQVMGAQAASSHLDTQYSHITRLNNLLADATAGLSPVLQDFFNGIHDVANNPADPAARQAMLSASSTLVSRYHSLDANLNGIRSEVESEIQTSVEAINSYVLQIARLNDQIATSESVSDGHEANDLRDQRDLLLTDLNKEIKTTVVRMADGGINVYAINGQALVLGNQSAQLSAQPSASDNTRTSVAYAMSGVTQPLRESDITGGRLGGLVAFRSETLDTAQNTLGRMAIGLALSFNEQHRLGQDLAGNPGGDYFSLASPVASPGAGNTGNAEIAAAFVDAGALTTSDYQIAYDGANYTITRLGDGAAQTAAALPAIVDGLQISLTSGMIAAGDRFLLRPARNGASGIGLAMSDPAEIAAAAPIRTGAASGNTGTATISPGAVDSSYPASPLAGPVTLTFNSATGMLSGFPAASTVTVDNHGTLATYAPGAPVPYAAGAKISFDGMTFSLSGAPANDDQFAVQPNTGGIGDNRNALLLAALQTRQILSNGTLNFTDAYGQLVSDTGSKTRELEVASGAQGKLLEEASLSQQSFSGVNLDEEATRLLRYQQAYQASAKVMQIASEMFDTLLSIGR
jgi:flagellar hook-associated protein 1